MPRQVQKPGKTMPEDEKTDHPWIVKTPGTVGGRPRIKGTRIAVKLVAGFFKMGETPDDILIMYPHLTLASIYDAVAYYLDHRDEIEPEFEEDAEIARDLDGYMARQGFVRDEKGYFRVRKATG